jgi:hypothetical protein
MKYKHGLYTPLYIQVKFSEESIKANAIKGQFSNDTIADSTKKLYLKKVETLEKHIVSLAEYGTICDAKWKIAIDEKEDEPMPVTESSEEKQSEEGSVVQEEPAAKRTRSGLFFGK